MRVRQVRWLSKIGHWSGVDLVCTWLRVVLSDEKGKFVGRIGKLTRDTPKRSPNKWPGSYVSYARNTGSKIKSLGGVGIVIDRSERAWH